MGSVVRVVNFSLLLFASFFARLFILDDSLGKYARILYYYQEALCRGGGYSCVSMLSIVQLCHVFYNALLANTLSRVCILQSKHCRVLLHRSVASHNYVQIHIWRRDLVTFVCACEHHGRRRYQVAARPWSAEIQGLGFADSAQG